PLRMTQAGDAVDDLARLDVDDADAVVAEFGDEETFAAQVERHMIDAADDLAERDLRLEPQWFGRLRRRACGGEPKCKGDDARMRKGGNREKLSVHAQSPRRYEHCAELGRSPSDGEPAFPQRPQAS